MPNSYFVGEIDKVFIDGNFVSVTFSIIPGNGNWNVRGGLTSGETATAQISDSEGYGILNHPLDIHYETSSSEGWPCLVVEVRLRRL